MTQQIAVVALVDDQERNLRIKGTKTSHLLILLGHQTLIQDGEFDKKSLLGEKEVRPKPTGGSAVIVPSQRKLEWLVNPRMTVQG